MSQIYTTANQIAHQFVAAGQVSAVEPLGNGNINSTFLVTVTTPAASAQQAPKGTHNRFVLQKINTHIFKQPERVIENMRVLSEHLQPQLENLPQRWEIPQLVPTHEGMSFFVDPSGNYWRAITFIENSEVFETITSVDHAKAVGTGLARFHSLISTLPAEQLADTLEGFHITPRYLANYQTVLDNWDEAAWQQAHPQLPKHRHEEVQHCLQFIAQRQAWAHVLEEAKAAGELPLRPIHGDPKVNNIMLDSQGEAVSLIDLDTIKPGLVHYDIGDCLRSGCNRLGEETKTWQQVEFDPELAEAMLKGYLSLANSFLTEADYQYLYDAIRLIAFELGLRFFTDYLAGNVYFKVERPLHNLDRALVQFQLTQSIETQEASLKAMIEALKPTE